MEDTAIHRPQKRLSVPLESSTYMPPVPPNNHPARVSWLLKGDPASPVVLVHAKKKDINDTTPDAPSRLDMNVVWEALEKGHKIVEEARVALVKAFFPSLDGRFKSEREGTEADEEDFKKDDEGLACHTTITVENHAKESNALVQNGLALFSVSQNAQEDVLVSQH